MSFGLSKFLSTANKVKKRVDKRINTVYHGTDADLTQDTIEPRNKSGSDFGTGIYWTSDKDTAKQYGKNIYQADVSFKNPLILENRYQMNGIWDEFIDKKQKGEIGDIEVNEYLRSQGYDGIIVKDATMGGDGEKKVPFFVSLDKTSHSNFGLLNYNNKVTDLENLQIEFAKVQQEIQDSGERVWNSEGNFANPKAHRLAEKIRDLKLEIRNDPNRAYTRHEFQDISPEQVQPHKGAHEFRGGSGYLLRPGQEKIMSDEDFAEALRTGILDKATVEKYGGSMMDDYVMPDGNTYTQQYIPIDGMRGAQFLKERYPSEGLINMMEGSKVKLDRPLYIYRNTGYRSVEEPDLKINPVEVMDDQVYSGMVINPNEVGSKEYISNLIKDGRMGGLHQDPKIIRIEPGTEIYHPGGIADLHEVVVPGSAIKEGQKWDAKDFIKLEPSDVKEGTDLFSSLGLMSNIA